MSSPEAKGPSGSFFVLLRPLNQDLLWVPLVEGTLMNPVSLLFWRSLSLSLPRSGVRGNWFSLLVVGGPSGDLEEVKGVDGLPSPEGWGEGLLPEVHRSPRVSLVVTGGGHPWFESRV